MAAPQPIPPAPDTPQTNRRKRGRVKVANLWCTLGHIMDLSGTGMRLRGTGLGPSQGSTVNFQIIGPEEKLPVQARVVWIKRKLLRFEAGMEFTGLSANTRRSIAEIARMTATNTVDAGAF